MTDEELEAIRQRAEAATPGPWREYLERRDQISGCDLISTAGEDINMPGASQADYVFVAHARQDVPRLLEGIVRLRAKLARGAD